MYNNVYPCLWCNNNAQEVADFYTRVFKNAKIRTNNSIVATFEIEGQLFMALNGGERHRPNPSISFSVACDTDAETDKIWNILVEGGAVLMPLDKYDWSEKYGWLQDKFGVSWQVMRGKYRVSQKIVSSFMFSNIHQGKAGEAINFYTAIFNNSEKYEAHKYPDETPGIGGQIVHAEFKLEDKLYIAMDSGVPQPFTFTEGISHVVECETQQEIDHFWNAITKKGTEDMCGWCKDEFGVSWQIVPKVLGRLMSDPKRAPAVTAAFLKMKKFDIATLLNA